MFYVPANSHADDQLAHLLRLLPLAPQGWVLKAQRTLLDMSTREQHEAAVEGMTDRDLAELARELEIDPLFRKRFDADLQLCTAISTTFNANQDRIWQSLDR